MMRRLTLAFLLVAAPGLSEEPPFALDPPGVAFQEEESEPSEADEGPRFHAAGWCSLTDSDEGDEPEEDEVSDPGCDAGLGVSLYRSKKIPKLSAVAVVGSETVGAGAAWTARRGRDHGPTIAVAVGLVAPYDAEGIYVDKAALAVGATFGIGGRRR